MNIKKYRRPNKERKFIRIIGVDNIAKIIYKGGY